MIKNFFTLYFFTEKKLFHKNELFTKIFFFHKNKKNSQKQDPENENKQTNKQK